MHERNWRAEVGGQLSGSGQPPQGHRGAANRERQVIWSGLCVAEEHKTKLPLQHMFTVYSFVFVPRNSQGIVHHIGIGQAKTFNLGYLPLMYVIEGDDYHTMRKVTVSRGSHG